MHVPLPPPPLPVHFLLSSPARPSRARIDLGYMLLDVCASALLALNAVADAMTRCKASVEDLKKLQKVIEELKNPSVRTRARIMCACVMGGRAGGLPRGTRHRDEGWRNGARNTAMDKGQGTRHKGQNKEHNKGRGTRDEDEGQRRRGARTEVSNDLSTSENSTFMLHVVLVSWLCPRSNSGPT